MCLLEWKGVIEWDHLKPQGLGWLLATLPSQERYFIAAVLPCGFFFFSMRRHWENPHGHRQQLPKHPAGTETSKRRDSIQTPTSGSRWILLVDLSPGN